MVLNPQTLDEQVAFYQSFGYVIIENAVSSDYLAQLQTVIDRVMNDKLPWRNLLATDPIFEAMVDGHAGFPLLERLIGDDIQLLSIDLRTCSPGSGDMPWHADHPYFTPVVNTINTALYLDDLTPHNGALRVVPGSHKTPFYLTQEEQFAPVPGETLVECKAGTMVVFDDNLWHRTGNNLTDRPRRGIFTYYGHFWHKQCTFAENPLPFHRMTQFIEGKGPKRAQLMGVFRKGSEFNPYETMLVEDKQVQDKRVNTVASDISGSEPIAR